VASVGAMSWLKRSSGDEPPGEQAPEVERPEIEPLSAAEVEWVRSTVAGLAEQDVLDHNIDDLGRHYDELLTVWLRLREPDRPDPSTVAAGSPPGSRPARSTPLRARARGVGPTRMTG